MSLETPSTCRSSSMIWLGLAVVLVVGIGIGIALDRLVLPQRFHSPPAQAQADAGQAEPASLKPGATALAIRA